MLAQTRCICLFLLLCASLSTSSVHSKEAIVSSVSPEFIDGLHTKYLRYLAEKAGMDLDINPMPFARRLNSLKRGDIDLMVGVKSLHEENGDFIFLHPSYEKLRGAFFVRSDKKDVYAKESDSKSIIIGVSIDEKKIQEMAERKYKQVVPVSNLRQKIIYLHKGRVDSFAHFEASALKMIEELGLEKDIVLAPFQNEVPRDYFFALSTKSPLIKYKDKFEEIIKQGYESGDFLEIRMEHYQSQN